MAVFVVIAVGVKQDARQRRFVVRRELYAISVSLQEVSDCGFAALRIGAPEERLARNWVIQRERVLQNPGIPVLAVDRPFVLSWSPKASRGGGTKLSAT